MRTTDTVNYTAEQHIAHAKAIGFNKDSLLQAIAKLYDSGAEAASGILFSLFAACKFDWVNENITPENFPVTEEPPPDTEYKLVCLEKIASTEQAEAEIGRRGLEIADLADLLCYVKKNPDEQRKYPIVALGSRWQDSSGYWCSPYASGWDGRRRLDLDYREDGWYDSCRFLARKPWKPVNR